MKEKNNKETSKVSKIVSAVWNRFLKPFFKGLWVLLQIILFGLFLYMFSEYVLQGISESSVIYLTIGVGGYMLIGIVAFIAIYQIFFAYNTARRNDLKLSELRWKLDDVHREVKDLKQSLEK